MARIMIKCPDTGKAVDTGLRMDESAFKAASLTGNSFHCQQCNLNHTWHKYKAFLEEEQS